MPGGREWVAARKPGKNTFRAKAVARDEEGPFTIQESPQQKDLIILNTSVSNNRAPKYTAKTNRKQHVTDKCAMVVRGFNALPSVTDGHGQKVGKADTSRHHQTAQPR